MQSATEINDTIKQINDKLDSIKAASKESKRSPARHVQIEEEITPVQEQRLTPIPLDKDPLDGIILAVIATNTEVKVTSSSSDHNDPSIVTKREGNDYWMSLNKPEQWIKFKFGGKQVKITSYTIGTIKFGEDSCHLKSWVLEGSNDDIEYTLIDTQETNQLNGSNKVVTFTVGKDTGSFKYLQTRSTGPNCRGDNTMAIRSVEFFGILIDC